MESGAERLWRALPGIVALAACVVIGNVLVLLGRGIDFTDGGNAWMLVVAPGDSPTTVSQSGFVHHPVFELLGSHDLLFQRGNALLTVALATWLGWHLVHALALAVRPATAGALALAVGASSFAMLFQWQAPPNYKWLTVQGLLVVAVALVARPGSRRRDVVLGACLGVGGWLAFMGKPSAGAGVAVLAVAHLVASRTDRTRAVVAAPVAAVLLAGSAIAIDGSVGAFVTRLRAGIASGAVLTPRHGLGSLVRLDLPNWTAATTFVLLATTAVVAALAVGAGRTGPTRGDRSMPATWGLVTAVATTGLAFAAVAIASTTVSWWLDFEWGQGVWALAVPAAALVAVAVVRTTHDPPGHGRGGDDRADRPLATRRLVADVVLLLALPSVYALGSNNNYWHEAGRAGVFWLAAAVPLVGLVRSRARTRRRMVAVVLVGTQVVTAGLVAVGARQPYHQEQPLRTMHTTPTVDAPMEGMRLSADQAAFVDELLSKARAGGWRAGTDVIDLSGHSPGMVYLLEGRSLGRSWLIGGYRGSEEVAVDLLAAEGCEAVATAWILQHPGARWRLGDEVPAAFGLDPAADYQVVAAATAPDGTPRQLSVPRREPAEAIAACRRARTDADPGPTVG